MRNTANETTALKEVLRWASRERDKKDRSLLERARAYLLEFPNVDKYETELKWVGDAWEWDCDCPYAKKTGKPCKHVIGKIILQEKEELQKISRKWDEFFKEYERVKAEKDLSINIPEEFGNF